MALLKGAHLLDHGRRCRIGLKPQRLRPRESLGGGLAVLLVVIPLTAEGLTVLIQEHTKALAPLSIEELHAQLLVRRRPGGKRFTAPEERIVRDPVNGQWQWQPLDRSAKATIHRLHDVQFLDAVLFDPLP